MTVNFCENFAGWVGTRVVALEDMTKLSGQNLAVFQQELGNELFTTCSIE